MPVVALQSISLWNTSTLYRLHTPMNTPTESIMLSVCPMRGDCLGSFLSDGVLSMSCGRADCAMNKGTRKSIIFGCLLLDNSFGIDKQTHDDCLWASSYRGSATCRSSVLLAGGFVVGFRRWPRAIGLSWPGLRPDSVLGGLGLSVNQTGRSSLTSLVVVGVCGCRLSATGYGGALGAGCCWVVCRGGFRLVTFFLRSFSSPLSVSSSRTSSLPIPISSPAALMFFACGSPSSSTSSTVA